MISYEQALQILRRAGEEAKLGCEEIALDEACGRVTAAPITSEENVPPFDNSAMDGFAVRASDTASASSSNPIVLRVVDRVAAGEQPASVTCAGAAVEIMTGAPMPPSPYDAVIRVEDIVGAEAGALSAAFDSDEIRLRMAVKPGANVRRAGTDFHVGQLVVPPALRLKPEHLMALASIGVKNALVQRRPRVFVVSTGKELVPWHEPVLKPGQIRNSTAPFLLSAMRNYGIDPFYQGVVPDDAWEFARNVESAMAQGADVVLSTGAVSAGKFDFVREQLEGLGARVLFHKCAIRPGKPLLFAILPNGAVFFGVPGNPVSTAVALRFFVDPFLRAAMGLEAERPIMARLGETFEKPDGLRCFFKGVRSMDENGVTVRATGGQASYVVRSLLEANAWVVFREQGDRADAGTIVETYSLEMGL